MIIFMYLIINYKIKGSLYNIILLIIIKYLFKENKVKKDLKVCHINIVIILLLKYNYCVFDIIIS